MKNKKKLAARILKTSQYKVRFATDALDDIKKAITRSDLRGLIAVGKVSKSHEAEHSKGRARKKAAQKRKGRQQGHGRRKGGKYATVSRKRKWIDRIRSQRSFLSELRESEVLSSQTFRLLYSMSKGGYFRSKRHIKLYMTEHNLFERKAESPVQNDIKSTGSTVTPSKIKQK